MLTNSLFVSCPRKQNVNRTPNAARCPTYSDIDVFLGRRLVELEAERVGQLLSPLEGDDALVLHVALVAHQDDLRVVPGVRLDLGAPKVKKSFLLVVRKSWMILDSMNDLLD